MATVRRDVVPFPAPEREVITRRTPLDRLPQMLTPAECAAFLGLGRDASYLFAQQHGRRIGRRLFVARRTLEELTGAK